MAVVRNYLGRWGLIIRSGMSIFISWGITQMALEIYPKREYIHLYLYKKGKAQSF
jgi:hypothetical protein